MTPRLSDGLYPFIHERLPLSELLMVEAPSDLEALFKSQAAANGIEIVRDEPVELRCQSEQYPDAIRQENAQDDGRFTHRARPGSPGKAA
jgi:hypothetical protein